MCYKANTNMISFKEIKKRASKEDYKAVAEATDYSLRSVRAIVYGERKDLRNVQLAFSIIMNQRKELKSKLRSITK